MSRNAAGNVRDRVEINLPEEIERDTNQRLRQAVEEPKRVNLPKKERTHNGRGWGHAVRSR